VSGSTPWWDRDRHADRRGFLLARNAIKAALRGWFSARGFTEVEAGQLALSPGGEAHLHGFSTTRVWPDGRAATRHLHTSPELACKKLLAAGETAIFDFARVFRNREAGPWHAAEFTMLEWYRAHADWSVVIADALDLARAAARAAGAAAFSRGGADVIPIDAPVDRLTLQEAFARHAGVDLLATVDPAGVGDRDALARAAASAGVGTSGDDGWSDIFSKLLVAKVEPHLGRTRPTILCEYPAEEAALARRAPHDRRVAERFELYLCGVELANGFGELTDPVEQRARMEAERAVKLSRHGEAPPLDEDFLAALAHMPPASGVAMGFDRLVMLCTGATRIDQVQWTPEV
jgi:lysyl-tRNA synthetase class 2